MVKLELKQGDTFRRSITWSEEDGTPIDLTGSVIEMNVAPRYGGTPLFTFSAAPQIVVDELAGKIDLRLLPEDTKPLGDYETWVYDLTVTDGNGDRTTLLDGQLLIAKEVDPS